MIIRITPKLNNRRAIPIAVAPPFTFGKSMTLPDKNNTMVAPVKSMKDEIRLFFMTGRLMYLIKIITFAKKATVDYSLKIRFVYCPLLDRIISE